MKKLKIYIITLSFVISNHSLTLASDSPGTGRQIRGSQSTTELTDPFSDRVPSESCEAPDNVDWFDDGQYRVGKKKDWDQSLKNIFQAYSLKDPIKGNGKADKWNSEFAKSGKKPNSRKKPETREEFFSRGTMYRFVFKDINDIVEDASQNWRLLTSKVVGVQTKLQIYRIDHDKNAMSYDCDNNASSKGELIHEIPYFSLRTSGNRTNQMPKSSFKVKVLKPSKWRKQALSQYESYVNKIKSSVSNINSTAHAIFEKLNTLRAKEGEKDSNFLNQLKTNSKDEFLKMFTSNGVDLSTFADKAAWELGQLRNGMSWHKGELKTAVDIVKAGVLEEVLEEYSSLMEKFKELSSAGVDLQKDLTQFESLGVIVYKEEDHPEKGVDFDKTKAKVSKKLAELTSYVSILEEYMKTKTNKGLIEKIEVNSEIEAEKDKAKKLFDMDAINLKAMWNDPSQMREALAWYMFEKAGVVAPKQTYAKVCFDNTYRGVFSVIEQVDESFLAHRELVGKKDDKKTRKALSKRANLYKVYMGTRDVGMDTPMLEEGFKSFDYTQLQDAELIKSEEVKNTIINAFNDHPDRGGDALKKSFFAKYAPFSNWVSEKKYDYYFKNIGNGTLQKLDEIEKQDCNDDDEPVQVSPYYKARNVDNRTYKLKTDWKGNIKKWNKQNKGDSSKSVSNYEGVDAIKYKDLEHFIKVINSGDYESDSYNKRLDEIFDTKSFLRWAAVTVLLGGWDNYYYNAQNYYLLNTNPYEENGSVKNKYTYKPKFVWVPWDYDQSFSMSFGQSATLWWDTDILDWESMRREKRADKPGISQEEKEEYKKLVQRPLITNMLKNPKYKRYYLQFIDWMIHNYFHVKNVASLIGKVDSLGSDQLKKWETDYQTKFEEQQSKHKNRIDKEVWDWSNNEEFAITLNERQLKETTKGDLASWINAGGTYKDFQKEFIELSNESKKTNAVSDKRCDQEVFFNPTEEEKLQCEYNDVDHREMGFAYAAKWRTPEMKPKDSGIWGLISNSVYEEHMGLKEPRWDIMSRTGRQYRNYMVFENGVLGRRYVWKELWQKSENKCVRQYKIFEGIEHHVRERGRTALKRIKQEVKAGFELYKNKKKQKVRELKTGDWVNSSW